MSRGPVPAVRAGSAAPGRASSFLPAWQGRDLTIILLARLTMSAARGIAGVVTALYLAAEGFSGLEIGVLFAGVTVASALMASVIGLVSDRLGRKPFLVAVPLLAAGAAAVYAEVHAQVPLYACAALGSFGRGAGAGAGSVGPYQPAESAFVAERVPAAWRSSAFGRVAFMSTLGALVGGLLAGLARAEPHMGAAAATAAYRPAFLAAASLAATAGVLALWLEDPASRLRLRTRTAPAGDGAGRGTGATERARPRRGESRTPGPARPGWPRRSWPALWRLWVANGINGVALGLFPPFLSYWLHRRYGVGAGEIGLLFALVNAGSLASTLVAAPIGRRLGAVRAIAAARAFSGLLLLPMAVAPSFALAGGLYFARMLAQRVGMPLRQSFTQDLAHPAERASVAALSVLPSQATMAASQPVAGLLFELSLAAPLLLGGVSQCANALAYVVLFTPAPSGADEDVTGEGPGLQCETAPVPVPAPAPGARRLRGGAADRRGDAAGR